MATNDDPNRNFVSVEIAILRDSLAKHTCTLSSHSSERTARCAQKEFEGADIVRDTPFPGNPLTRTWPLLPNGFVLADKP